MKFPIRTVLALVLASVTAFSADLTITSQVSSKKPLGTQVQYFTAQAMRTNDEATKIDSVIDYTKGVISSVNHKQKKIEQITFDDLAKLGESLNQTMGGAAGAMMGAMMGKMMGDPDDVKVEDLGAEKVAGRTCTKHRITVGKLVHEVSADPSLKHPANPATVAKAMKLANMLKGMGPMAKSFTRLGEELSKIKGIPLKTHVSGFMGMDTTVEATEVKLGPVAASVFDLPAGYKVEDLGKKLQAEMAKHAE